MPKSCWIPWRCWPTGCTASTAGDRLGRALRSSMPVLPCELPALVELVRSLGAILAVQFLKADRDAAWRLLPPLLPAFDDVRQVLTANEELLRQGCSSFSELPACVAPEGLRSKVQVVPYGCQRSFPGSVEVCQGCEALESCAGVNAIYVDASAGLSLCPRTPSSSSTPPRPGASPPGSYRSHGWRATSVAQRDPPPAPCDRPRTGRSPA